MKHIFYCAQFWMKAAEIAVINAYHILLREKQPKLLLMTLAYRCTCLIILWPGHIRTMSYSQLQLWSLIGQQ
jgi:hypothetical protein